MTMLTKRQFVNTDVSRETKHVIFCSENATYSCLNPTQMDRIAHSTTNEWL